MIWPNLLAGENAERDIDTGDLEVNVLLLEASARHGLKVEVDLDVDLCGGDLIS